MRTRTLIVPSLMLVLAAGCGGNDSKKAASDATTTTAAGETTTSGGAPASGAAGSTTTTKKGTTATTASKLAVGGTTVPVSTKNKPPAPGTYTYDQQGSSTFGSGASQQQGQVPATATLTVEAAQGARQRSVRESRTDADNSTTTETILEYRDDGAYLVYLRTENKTKQGGFPVTITSEFEPSSPVLFAPLPAVKGRSWTIDLTSKDGCQKVHTDASWRDTNQPVTIGGKALSTDVAHATIKVTPTGQSGCQFSVEATQDDTQWLDPASRLQVKDELHATGKIGGTIPFTQDVTATLRSTSPS